MPRTRKTSTGGCSVRHVKARAINSLNELAQTIVNKLAATVGVD